MVERKNPESQVTLAEIQSAYFYSRAFSDFVGSVLKKRYPLVQNSDFDISGRDPDVFLPQIIWSGFDKWRANSLKESFLRWCGGRSPIIMIPTRDVTADEIKAVYFNYNHYRPDSISISYGSYPLKSRYVAGFGSIGSDSFTLAYGPRTASELGLVDFFGSRGIRLGKTEEVLTLVLRRPHFLRVEEMILPLPAGWPTLVGPTGLNDRLKRLETALSEFQKREDPREVEASAFSRLVPVRYFPKIEGSSPGEELIKLLSQGEFERFMNLAISRFSGYPRNFFSPSEGMRGGTGILITMAEQKLPVNIEYSPANATCQKLRLSISGLKINNDRLEVMERGSGSPCRMVLELTYEGGRLRVDSRVERFGYQWEPCGDATEMVNDDFICQLVTGIEPAREIDLPIERRERRDEDERKASPYSSSVSYGYGGSLSSRASIGPVILPDKKPPRFLSSNARRQAGRAEKVRRQKERGRKSARKGK